jgi:hypothetical protein
MDSASENAPSPSFGIPSPCQMFDGLTSLLICDDQSKLSSPNSDLLGEDITQFAGWPALNGVISKLGGDYPADWPLVLETYAEIRQYWRHTRVVAPHDIQSGCYSKA